MFVSYCHNVMSISLIHWKFHYYCSVLACKTKSNWVLRAFYIVWVFCFWLVLVLQVLYLPPKLDYAHKKKNMVLQFYHVLPAPIKGWWKSTMSISKSRVKSSNAPQWSPRNWVGSGPDLGQILQDTQVLVVSGGTGSGNLMWGWTRNAWKTWRWVCGAGSCVLYVSFLEKSWRRDYLNMLQLRCMFIGTYHVQLRDLIFQTAIAFANA